MSALERKKKESPYICQLLPFLLKAPESNPKLQVKSCLVALLSTLSATNRHGLSVCLVLSRSVQCTFLQLMVRTHIINFTSCLLVSSVHEFHVPARGDCSVSSPNMHNPDLFQDSSFLFNASTEDVSSQGLNVTQVSFAVVLFGAF